MRKKVFNLKHVGEQEAQDVRALLQAHDIGFYETQENIWHTSSPAIWVYDDSAYRAARELIEHYQQQRQARFREQPVLPLWRSWWRDFLRQPLRFLFFVIAAVAVIYLSVWPFFGWT
ncbi:MAG: hypothetical protein HKO71_00960 [Pseudomonadales bacterium]|nr:hypothetical protein [Gammaproteobacteria bacterium]NNL56295.1 hypothetical protein [Pseudomonadales bacterium]